MTKGIIKCDPSSEFYTEERCFITELLNNPSNATYSIAQARVEAGVTTALHRLKDTDERYIITAGEGCAEVGELPPTQVSVGDIVNIPSETPQRITNTGEEDLVFLCICTPRFAPDCYVDLENRP